jgi:hypothetical protein
MFQNLHFRLISVAQILLSKKSILLFFLFIFFGNLTFAQAPGNTLDFDGTNNGVSLGTNLSFPNTTSITIEAWLCRNTGSGGMVIGKFNGGIAGQYSLSVNTDGILSFSIEIAQRWITTTTVTGFTGNCTAPSLSTAANYNLSI